MIRLVLALIGIGAFVAFMGIQELRVGAGASAEAVAADLAALEKGEAPPDNHIKLGEHFPVYFGMVYEYDDSVSKGDAATVNHCYYPIVSMEHSFKVTLDKLTEEYGDLAFAPEEELPDPSTMEFAVMVKTSKYGTVGALPDWADSEPGVQGLLVSRIHKPDSEEQGLIRSSFSKVDFDKILILEEGRKPSAGGGGALLVVGIVLILGGLGLGAKMMGVGEKKHHVHQAGPPPTDDPGQNPDQMAQPPTA